MSKTSQQDTSGPSYEAARHLVDFLDDACRRTGYRPAGAKIQLEDEGHVLSLPCPPKGFSEYQLECIQEYAQGLAYWRDVCSELSQLEKTVEIRFRITLSEKETQSLPLRDRLRRALMPRDHKLARLVGQILAGKGFKVREPTSVVLITREQTFRGYALQVRYPFERGQNEAGVSTAYDRIVPMIADAFAREHGLRCEVQRHGELTTIFFTRDRAYLSSLYDTVPQFRIALPRRKSMMSKDIGFFWRKSYRACKALRRQYGEDFIMPRRPNPLWDDSGYCVVMLYKRGASGTLVDSSYSHAVANMAQQLAKRYRLKASIDVRPEIRTIVANFSDRGPR